MKDILELQRFIAEHEDWETILQDKPYCITISRDVMFGHKLIMFKYNQIESDFKNEIVRECRGLILDEDTFKPVCVPFFKFGNYGEIYCPDIDWKSCWVGEKLDGSLIKIVRLGDDFLWSTNGTIDAFKAPLAEQIGCIAKTFGELAENAMVSAYRKARSLDMSATIDFDIMKGWMKAAFKEGYTYMFELTSPYNKVVVQWHETRLNFLGVRNNTTLQETYFSDHEFKNYFNTPKVFPLRTIDECVAAAEKLDCNNEGFVVCDKNFNRVKVKSPTYVALHHMRNNGILSYERGIEIVRGNELAEVLTYFPEFKEHLEKIQVDYNNFISKIKESVTALDNWLKNNGYADRHWLVESGGINRKDAAIWIQKNFKFPGLGFMLLDKKVNSADEWIKNVSAKDLVKLLGYKD